MVRGYKENRTLRRLAKQRAISDLSTFFYTSCIIQVVTFLQIRVCMYVCMHVCMYVCKTLLNEASPISKCWFLWRAS